MKTKTVKTMSKAQVKHMNEYIKAHANDRATFKQKLALTRLTGKSYIDNKKITMLQASKLIKSLS